MISTSRELFLDIYGSVVQVSLVQEVHDKLLESFPSAWRGTKQAQAPIANIEVKRATNGEFELLVDSQPIRRLQFLWEAVVSVQREIYKRALTGTTAHTAALGSTVMFGSHVVLLTGHTIIDGKSCIPFLFKEGAQVLSDGTIGFDQQGKILSLPGFISPGRRGTAHHVDELELISFRKQAFQPTHFVSLFTAPWQVEPVGKAQALTHLLRLTRPSENLLAPLAKTIEGSLCYNLHSSSETEVVRGLHQILEHETGTRS